MAKVDILNYISDSNILRSTYDTDTNELDITDVPQNLNSVITLGQGGGGSVTVEELNVTENGTYEAPEGKAYSPVNVNVENYYDCVQAALTDTPVDDLEFEVTSGTNLVLSSAIAKNIKVTGTVTEIPNNSILNEKISGVIDLPTITKINTSCWSNNVSHQCTVIYMPNATTIGSNFLQTTTATWTYLSKVVMGAGCFTGGTSLARTPQLKALVFPQNSVAALAAASRFEACGVYNNADGYVYVPRSLIDSYKAATNWSNYPDKFRAIEDYPLINAPTTWLPTEG